MDNNWVLQPANIRSLLDLSKRQLNRGVSSKYFDYHHKGPLIGIYIPDLASGFRQRPANKLNYLARCE